MLASALGVEYTREHDAGLTDIVDRAFPSRDAENFRDLYLLKEVLRKFPGFDLGIDTKQVALDSFFADEKANAKTNDRLHSYNRENPCVNQILDLACRKAVGVLGDFRWDWWLKGCRFGPGATTRLTSERASVARKLSGVPHVTSRASGLARELLSLTPSWGYRVSSGVEVDLPVEIRESDKVAVVTKNAKTGRTIGIPPCMNIYMQLGMGYCMRRKMARWGINLNDQSVNQKRALAGSILGTSATLDLKSASQSVVSMLVWRFFGNHSHDRCDPTWFAMLDALRVEWAMVGDKLHRYELFSAMGNGFTFELESLIFWALAVSTCEFLGIPPDVSVYGDDLIVPVESVDTLVLVLDWCGFKLNEDKSFVHTTGHIFRESCGKHYLDGMDVTPFYVDTELKRSDQIILLANNLMRWATSSQGYRDGRVLPVYHWILAHLPSKALKTCIPMGESDDGLIKSFDEVSVSLAYLRSDGLYASTFIGYRAHTVEYIHRERLLDGEDGYISAQYRTSYTRFSLGEGVPWYQREVPQPQKTATSRRKSLRYKKRVISQWPNLGPWITNEDCLYLGAGDLELAVSLCKASSYFTSLPGISTPGKHKDRRNSARRSSKPGG
jgi:hypothetical protein